MPKKTNMNKVENFIEVFHAIERMISSDYVEIMGIDNDEIVVVELLFGGFATARKESRIKVKDIAHFMETGHGPKKDGKKVLRLEGCVGVSRNTK